MVVKVEYAGRDRYTLPGSLRYPGGPPPLGTILGPNGLGEYVTVVAHDNGRALVAVATAPDMAAAAGCGEPRSMVEQKLYAGRR